MDLFARLQAETLRAAAENDLPEFLAERLLAIAGRPECYVEARDDIEQLVEMLPLYDTYGQTGYIGMGVSNLILEAVLRRIEAKKSAGNI